MQVLRGAQGRRAGSGQPHGGDVALAAEAVDGVSDCAGPWPRAQVPLVPSSRGVGRSQEGPVWCGSGPWFPL